MLCGFCCAPIATETNIAAASQAATKLDRMSRFIFPFPTHESPVGFPKISEQPNLERSALFVLILVGWTLRRLRLRFWTPHVPKCKQPCNDEDGHHPSVGTPLKRKGFSRANLCG